ncbi:YceH family protein [Granulosicoccus sp. 3-233]|uniref:YceH family protein n=1 Tax=Granulosicoccus sp. 3-233 TaxID=3417969 RepID=UPI003D34B27A
MEDQDDTLIDESQTPQTPEPPQLTAIELRVLGALMEKQLTTPDQYPLTVNSLLNACNQKSSREPITNYQQGEIVRTLQGLVDKDFVRKEYGSRADKFSQLFMPRLELGKKQQAVLCLLMLRGPQTLSELHARTQRMELFTDRDELTHCVERLCDRELPFVTRMGAQSGQRGERFGHLFCGMPDLAQGRSSASDESRHSRSRQDEREMLALLESDVNELNKSMHRLESENRTLRRQLEDLYQLTGHAMPERDEPGPQGQDDILTNERQ